MNARTKKVMEAAFGKARSVEGIRTSILFKRPYGDISVPDIKLGAELKLCVARAPDEKFYEECYWASYGPKPSDDDPDVFVVPVVIKPYDLSMCDNWAQVCDGKFITTDSGVIVLDVRSLWAWEGYSLPGKRDYNFDRRRLEKSAAALKALVDRS